MTIKLNYFAKGSLCTSPGEVGILDCTAGTFENGMYDFLSNAEYFRLSYYENSDFPNFWLIPGVSKTFLILYDGMFTQFKDRHYDQCIVSWIDNTEINGINLGDIVTSCKLFRQYRDICSGKPDGIVEITSQKVLVPSTLVDCLAEVGDYNKKIIIEINPKEVNQLRGNDFFDHRYFKNLFYALGELPESTRKKIGISTGKSYSGYHIQIPTGTEVVTEPKQDAYYRLSNGWTLPSDSLRGKIASLFRRGKFIGAVPERKWNKPVTKNATFQTEFGALASNVLLQYSAMDKSLIEAYERNGWKILKEDILI